jgi:leucyl/phenylalanyl-tRNA--protein transferase
MRRRLTWIEPNDPLPDTACALTLEEGANGLLAAGSDLSSRRLIEAYRRGIFPWFSRGEPVLWWTPSPRAVLLTEAFKVSKSLRKTIQRMLQDPSLSLTIDQDFVGVMRSCAAPRAGQAGSWISGPMIQAYAELHHQGLAHSVELRRSGQLRAGLYCVAMGRMVYGESMFTQEPDASKVALAALVGWLRQQGGPMIDCQQHTAHLTSLGAQDMQRAEFEERLSTLTLQPPLPWRDQPPSMHSLALLLEKTPSDDHGPP